MLETSTQITVVSCLLVLCNHIWIGEPDDASLELAKLKQKLKAVKRAKKLMLLQLTPSRRTEKGKQLIQIMICLNEKK